MRIGFPLSTVALAVIVVAAALESISSADDRPSGVTVVGDRALLNAAIEAQKLNIAAFPNGRLRFDARQRSLLNAKPVEEQYIGSLCWEGASTRWRYDMTDREIDTGKVVRQSRNIDMIAGRTRIISYWQDTDGLFESEPGRKSIVRLLQQRPDQYWYRTPSGGTRLWSDYLDPNFPNPNVDKLVVERGADETIVIHRHLKAEGVSTVTVSLKLGGNIVRYEMTPLTPREGFSHHGRRAEYDWVMTPGGHYRLKKLTYLKFDEVITKPVYMHSVDVSEFDSPTYITKDEFILKSRTVD